MNIKSSKGIGIVELLVALVLSSIVSIAIIQLFIQNKVSYIAHENVVRLQENGRYAIQLLTRALRSADYWGCIPSFQNNPSPNIAPVAVNVVDTTTGIAPTITSGIVGTEGAVGTGPAGYDSFPDSFTISGVAGGRSFPLATPTTTADQNLTIDVGAITDTGISPNDVLVISDCTRADIFQATNDVNGSINTTTETATIQHANAPVVTTPPATLRNNTNSLTYTYGTLATVYRTISINDTYSIGNWDPDGVGPETAVPALMRNGVAIVPGIENMQVVYGVDDSGNNQVDRYVNATAVGTTAADWESVISARVSILARSPEARNAVASGYTMEGVVVDGVDVTPVINNQTHSRRVYTTTVAIRNRSG